jgi:hypothetical protein
VRSASCALDAIVGPRAPVSPHRAGRDNVLLSHAERSRIISDERRKRLFSDTRSTK